MEVSGPPLHPPPALHPHLHHPRGRQEVLSAVQDSGRQRRPPPSHRRRIRTEEKAKVVASVWEEEFIQFLATLAVLPMTILNNRMHQDDLKEKDEFNLFIKIILVKTASTARN